MKKTVKSFLALFALVCCLSGCSHIKSISENDERLAEAGDENAERIVPLGAWAAVYDGEYEVIEAPPNITRVIAPIGENGFLVENDGEYGIFTPNGEYRGLFPKYSEVGGKKMYSAITYNNDEYIVYYTSEENPGYVGEREYELHLLRLSDMEDKRIYFLPMIPNSDNWAVICDNCVYFEREEIKSGGTSSYDGDYIGSSIIKYDIENGKLEKFCRNAGSPVLYKGKLAFFVDGGKLVSLAEPAFIPEEYGLEDSIILPSENTIAYSYRRDGESCCGYIKDGKKFDIFQCKFGISSVDFSDGCAVWNNARYLNETELLPMFYSEKRNSIVVVDCERARYKSFINNGKMFFFGYDTDGNMERVLILDTDKI
ncbi:MAG: hypothetical protein HDT43_10920 [Ruminococcaceae bacterium]|nr:hypothetical protein [Oscillospiraceae bacterium]